MNDTMSVDDSGSSSRGRRPLLARLAGRSVLGGVMAISAGTVLAQGLTVLASPVIARLYSPTEVGIYTIIASIAAIIGTVASLRWDFAIPVPAEERDAHSLVALGLLSTLTITVIGTAVVAVFGNDICARFDEPQLMPWLILAPLVAGGQASMKVLNQLAVRHRRYASIGTRSAFRSLILVVTQVGLGLAGFRAGGLVVGLGVGNLAGAASLLRQSGLRSPEARRGRRRSALRAAARRFRRFPLYLAPSGLLNVLGLQLPVLLIFSLYGTSVAGWLGLAQIVLALPVALLGQAVAQVYLGELARSKRASTTAYQGLFRRVSRNLCIVGGLLGAVVFFAGPHVFPIVFGEQWDTSGDYARALAPSLGMQMLAVPLSQTLVVSGRQRTQLAWDAGRLVLTVSAVYLCHRSGGSALDAVWLFSISSSAAYLVLWFCARYAVTHPGLVSDRRLES